jgi:hypothetical protein
MPLKMQSQLVLLLIIRIMSKQCTQLCKRPFICIHTVVGTGAKFGILSKFNTVHWVTWGLDGELELVEELCEEEGVGQGLPHLHDPHNGRVNLYT